MSNAAHAPPSDRVAPSPAIDPLIGMVDSAAHALLYSIIHNAPPPSSEREETPSPPSPPSGFDWNLFESTEDTRLQAPSVEQLGAAGIAQQLLDHLDSVENVNSDDEPVERSDGENEHQDDTEPTIIGELFASS